MTLDEDDVVLGLMETLLPGGAGFPPARETGTGAALLARLRQADAMVPARLAVTVAARGTLPADPAGWQDFVARLEALEPKLFDELRKYAYLTYYEQPAVIAAIRGLGFRYNDSPLPAGYPNEPFDPARDAPQHGRGRWLRTEEVRRVDLSGLGLDATP